MELTDPHFIPPLEESNVFYTPKRVNRLLHQEPNGNGQAATQRKLSQSYDVKDGGARDEFITRARRLQSVVSDVPIVENIGGNVDEDDFRSFIRNREIFVRYCNKHVPDKKRSDGRCQCGRSRDWHEKQEIALSSRGDPDDKWRPTDDYTTRRSCDAFGVIEFSGFGQETSRRVPYVRVDWETDASDLRDLLSDQWNIPSPRLIISVTGGAKSFYMKTRLKNTIKRGLMNAATSTGAWIITGGTSTGVMEFVGDAVKDFHLQSGSSEQQVVALGIATWGIVDNKRSLICDDEKGNFPAYYNSDDLQSGKATSAPLDHNHTHFILVDNGTENQFGVEIKLRATLEQYISEVVQTGVSENQSVHVPVVLLVLEGGENTLATAAAAISTGTPVVVIQGSGRCADLVADAYSMTKSKDSSDESAFQSNFDDDITQRATATFDWLSVHPDESVRREKAAKCINELRAILNKRRLLTVFQLDQSSEGENEIDQAILYALLKANKSDVQTQLNLALAWNRSDMARKEIFNIENRTAWQKLDLDTAMFEALVQDRVDFVQLFIDSGVNFKKFLSVRRLRDLYDKVINNPYHDASTDLLSNLVYEAEHKWYVPEICTSRAPVGPKANQLQLIGRVINYLIADEQKNIYEGKMFRVKGGDDSSVVTSRTNMSGDHADSEFSLDEMNVKQKFVPDFADSPEKELFIWAVLCNRRELSKLFWRNSKDHIGGALMASALLKALSGEADKQEEVDLSLDINAHAHEWEEIAVGVLNECYQKDKVMAHSLLTRQIRSWGGSTLFSIADAAFCMDFMGHSCCQTKLNRIWKGKMALYTSFWKIMLNLVLFLFCLPLIKFSPGEKKETEEDARERHKKSHNNNQVKPSKKGASGSGSDDDDTFAVSRARRPRQSTRKLLSVKVLPCGSTHNTISLWTAIHYFHTAPVVKFCYHTISYMVFMGFFSFFLMTDLRPVSNGNTPSVYEYLVWGWSGTMFLEEIRQLLTTKPKSIWFKFVSYFSSLWNVFDLLMFVAMIVCIVLRYALDDAHFEWARRMYSITIVLYCLRFMSVFYVSKNIGPKVIMIRRMLTDLAFFLVILIIVIFAYGVASQALRYPNDTVEWALLKDVVYLPYWQMYGELMLEEVEGDVASCSSNRTVYENTDIDRCPEESWLALLLFAAYMIFTNVLLLSLLIAMFSYTFERVQENSELVWRFFRYDLIYEYMDRPTLAAPLIIVSHVFRLLKYCLRKTAGVKFESDFEQMLDINEDSKLTAFEKAGMENYLHRQYLLTKGHIDVKVAATGERIEKVIEDLDRVREQFTHVDGSDSPALPNVTRLQNRIGQLEKQVSEQTKLLNRQSDQLAKVLDLLDKR